MSQYKPGARLRSAVCATEVVVIAAPARDIVLSCGGAPLLGEVLRGQEQRHHQHNMQRIDFGNERL